MAASITSTLPGIVPVGTTIPFQICTTATPPDLGTIVTIPIILANPAQRNDFVLTFIPPVGNPEIIHFDSSGRALFGPSTGFPLQNACSNFTIQFNVPGSYTYTLQIVRKSDGAILATFTQTVEAFLPTPPPTISCPPNITISNDPGVCGATVNYPPPMVTDECPAGFTVVCNSPSGSFFPVGATTVTCTVTDPCGGSASCTFTVTVNDTEPPAITCPADITVFNDPGRNGAFVNFPEPTVSDNCPGVTAVCTPASGSFFPPGTTTVTCTATDAAGNTSTCSFNVTVTVDPCRFLSRRC
ncbi:HYR domain-containing protein [Bacillus sp. EB600]|uniref:HYR domain-containing protein n=1 Tax=Bacillus sp. EB600 TaxID=2806345 RepID=UPI00210DDF59|nr:HYR domain-containing protein [Bacillus sp. EB600]MCQ6281037.1 HYR domain-containing protein [Bacillus sp. EB600]